VNWFVARHHDAIADGKGQPQENSRRELPREFLDHYLVIVRDEIVGLNPCLVFNRGETGTADWEERKRFDTIGPAAYCHERIHFPVQRRVKHQTMLVCINAEGNAPCLLITTADRATLGVFRDGIEENVDLQVHVGWSAYVDRPLFHLYVCHVLIPNIQLDRGAHGLPDALAVWLMDNCMTHLGDETMQLLSSNNVKIVAFPPHASGIFQMLDRRAYMCKSPPPTAAISQVIKEAPELFNTSPTTIRSIRRSLGFSYLPDFHISPQHRAERGSRSKCDW
jgi:hypothetical protein